LLIVADSVADPDPRSGAFYPLDPGSGSGMNYFRIPDPRGMFFGEIFLRILVLKFFLLIKLAPETIKSKKKLVLFFILIFMYRRISDPVLFHPPCARSRPLRTRSNPRVP
jgi:hypothetical protein